MIYNLLVNTLGKPKYESKDSHKKTTLDFNCPKCTEDNYGVVNNKYKLAVLLTTNKKVCKCWSCGYSSSIKWLLKVYGNEHDYQTYCDYHCENLEIEEPTKRYFIPRLPKEFVSFDDLKPNNSEIHKLAYDYILNNRKIDKYLVKKLNIGVCFDGWYKNRIIIPSYDENNNLTTFIGRTFIADVLPTYLAPTLEKDSFIFNESNINFNHPIYFVEGALDMTSMFINTIPLLGKGLFHNILEKILKYNSPVFIVLDEGTDKETDEIFYKFDLFGITNVTKIMVNYKDLNKMLQDFGQTYIIKNVLGYK